MYNFSIYIKLITLYLKIYNGKINYKNKINMNILVIGSGGREHAIIRCLKKSESCDNLYCIPGNPE